MQAAGLTARRLDPSPRKNAANMDDDDDDHDDDKDEDEDEDEDEHEEPYLIE